MSLAFHELDCGVVIMLGGVVANHIALGVLSAIAACHPEGLCVLQFHLVLLRHLYEGQPAESMTEPRAESLVEAAVDDGVVYGGAHGQPEDGQVYLLDVRLHVDFLVEAAQDEVDVVGQPAQGKGHHHHYHHLHHLAFGLDLILVVI